MVKNIAIIGLNRENAYQISKLLAEEMNMHFFDALELFLFDNAPKSFAYMLKNYGERFYRKKEKSILGYSLEFDNCVINFEGGISQNKENLKKIKTTCLLIYIHKDKEQVKKDLIKNKYKTEEEIKFFNISEEKIQKRIDNLEQHADIIIESRKESEKTVVKDIVKGILNYYKKV